MTYKYTLSFKGRDYRRVGFFPDFEREAVLVTIRNNNSTCAIHLELHEIDQFVECLMKSKIDLEQMNQQCIDAMEKADGMS